MAHHQSEDRRARRLRLYRLGAGAPAAAASARRDRAAHRRPPRRAGDGGGVSAVLALRRCRSCVDRRHRLGRRRARPDLLRAAACHHAEGDQAGFRGACPRPRWSTCRPTSGSPTLRAMRAGTATSTTRRSCSAQAIYGLVEVYRDEIKRAHLVANPGCYTTCAQLAADPAAAGQGDRSRRDRDRRQIRHDRRGPGGQGGDAVLGSLRRHPCLWRRPSPAHGGARPGILEGRRPRGDRSASRRI